MLTAEAVGQVGAEAETLGCFVVAEHPKGMMNDVLSTLDLRFVDAFDCKRYAQWLS